MSCLFVRAHVILSLVITACSHVSLTVTCLSISHAWITQSYLKQRRNYLRENMEQPVTQRNRESFLMVYKSFDADVVKILLTRKYFGQTSKIFLR